MASTSEEKRSDVVEFIHEGELITARDIETGVAASGETKAEALARLAEALDLHAGGGELVEDEDAVIEEIGLDPQEIAEARAGHDDLPEFLR